MPNALQNNLAYSATPQQAAPPRTSKEAAKQFEAFFLYQVIELMQPEVDKDSVFSGGFAEETFQHTLNEKMAEAITEKGGIGIADAIHAELLKVQELQSRQGKQEKTP